MKTTVIYHRADFDGLFCREIAHKFLPDAELIGWDFGDETLHLHGYPANHKFVVMDLPIDRVFGLPPLSGEIGGPFFEPRKKDFVWIDHHKTSIESHPTDIPGYRIDGVAACRLAWQWFIHDHTDFTVQCRGLPVKEEFTHRKVAEPLAVRLAGEYDIWDKRDPRAELFQHGLRGQPLGQNVWRWMLGTDCDESVTVSSVESLLKQGEVIQFFMTERNASIIANAGFTVEWEGLRFLACNAARFNSHLFAAGLKPDHDACLGFCFNGLHWKVSLYHAPGKEQHDLSLIAGKYKGGGHRGACGFTADKLPWLI